MTTQINPYLSFSGNCREAMSFYKDCLGGELTLQTVAESPMADQWPAALQQGVLHAALIKNGVLLLGSDMPSPDGDALVNGNAVALSLTCATPEEMDTFFEKLAAGGQVIRAPHEFFAGKIAALKDRFGMSWILYYSTMPQS
ncbi:VOC family protein [Chitinophaga agrisoli]|uniref:VOC family protein n=1 Tax=Chitinophaga agrisoli TaxID=2607653 RepID=A0A5B2VYJ4_9BACT|nr:VOC family protein [Chitinophaga agrisoli]KAA2243256.1 VOC family protein [Chitinophaga agrisoli]